MSAETTFAAPVVATHGAADPSAPLVVLLHGRGSNEQEILGIAPHLPQGVEYAAVRAPIAEGGGFAWFANRGIGRPVASSLQATMAWFRTWLDTVAPAGRPVVLVGFSGGAAFAGGLVLADPSRYAGAAILYGTLPFDAGLPFERSHLANLPVFVAQGEADHVIPRELLDRTWTWLHTQSGAPTVGRRDPGGHGLTAATMQRLAAWVAELFTHLAVEGAPPVGPPQEVFWTTVDGGHLPHREGTSPQVHWDIPQQQQSQNAPETLQEKLFERVSALAGVQGGPSRISVPGARAFTLPDGTGPDESYLVPGVREFAHLHPAYDGSLHLALPAAYAADLVAHGWGVPHPWAGTRLAAGFVMLFGPRTEDELETVSAIVTAAHAFASGTAKA
ncbi:phospholipase/carboxylesterase [Phycicoccus badiiscoriae]|uniref:Phospholipase/carboxylesterase n=1 Tax=Pedococcus badiiscoriae TaxID=642776 RepID=A0A852WI72_9MICO|nr:phospholipase/carboxylesterase [Pedococcus badiiscoriae]